VDFTEEEFRQIFHTARQIHFTQSQNGVRIYGGMRAA
jgi:hypothetical protein